MRRLLLTTALLVMMPSCIIMPGYQTLTGRMHGKVVNSKKEPVSGAKVEYFHGSTEFLGSTTTDGAGYFKMGPYRQWFYVAYIGSPGVCPFPLSLKCVGQPHALRVSKGEAAAIYLIGTPESFRQRWSSLISDDDMKALQPVRWTGLDETPLLILNPEMKAPDSPHGIAWKHIYPTQP
jgi:hypothetical protein